MTAPRPTINSTNARVDRLNEDLAEMRKHLDMFAARLAETHDHAVAGTYGTIKSLKQQLDNLETRLNHVSDGTPSSILGSINAEISRLNDRLNAFHADLQLQLDGHDARLNTVEDRVIGLVGCVDGLTVQTQANASAIAEVNTRLDERDTTPLWVLFISAFAGVLVSILWNTFEFVDTFKVNGETVRLVYRYAESGWTAIAVGLAVFLVLWAILGLIFSGRDRHSNTSTSSRGVANTRTTSNIPPRNPAEQASTGGNHDGNTAEHSSVAAAAATAQIS